MILGWYGISNGLLFARKLWMGLGQLYVFGPNYTGSIWLFRVEGQNRMLLYMLVVIYVLQLECSVN